MLEGRDWKYRESLEENFYDMPHFFNKWTVRLCTYDNWVVCIYLASLTTLLAPLVWCMYDSSRNNVPYSFKRLLDHKILFSENQSNKNADVQRRKLGIIVTIQYPKLVIDMIHILSQMWQTAPNVIIRDYNWQNHRKQILLRDYCGTWGRIRYASFTLF